MGSSVNPPRMLACESGVTASLFQNAGHDLSEPMIFGIGAATILRVIFALAASKMFAYLGLRLVGGLLLLWVCWKQWRELRDQGYLRIVSLAPEVI